MILEQHREHYMTMFRFSANRSRSFGTVYPLSKGR